MDAEWAILFVDLDGTLVNTDLLYESGVNALRRPFRLLRILSRPGISKARLKQTLAASHIFNASQLPYNQAVLDVIHRARSQGKRVILITAADKHFADAVAADRGVFDEVHGSNGELNLKSTTKLDLMKRLAGSNRFAYVGDSWADVPIFEAAKEAFLVGGSRSLFQATNSACSSVTRLSNNRDTFAAIWKICRPHQWVKNVLMFVPLILAHQFTDLSKTGAALLAFVCFSMTASSVYVTNDLLDIESDRKHHRKRSRPLAHGALAIPHAFILLGSLLLASWTIALLLLPMLFFVLMVGYYAVNILYTFWLKRKLLVDVLVLASLYTWRLLAGAAVTQVPISEWLLAFSVFLFTSLAFAKRFVELESSTSGDSENRISGRGYYRTDLDVVRSFGVSCSMIATLILALYINSPQVKILYTTPHALWLICPLLMYWTGRVWFLADRHHLNDDPVVFALKDRISWYVALAILGAMGLATLKIPILS